MSYLTQFLQSIRDKDFVVLDTETTGLDDSAEICQIAIISNHGDVLLNSFVKPTKPIPADATRIHGITNEMVANAPEWARLMPTIKRLIQDTPLIIYNAAYDLRIMEQTCLFHNSMTLNWWQLDSYCAMEAYAEYHGNYNRRHDSYTWVNLSIAAGIEGVKVENAHDALGDCLMTKGIIEALLKKGQGQS